MSRQIVIVSRLRSLAVTPDPAIAAALHGDGYRPADLRRLIARTERHFDKHRMISIRRDGFRVVALSAGDGLAPQTRVVLLRTARGWILESSETPAAILSQREQVRIIASRHFSDWPEYCTRRGYLRIGEDIDLTPPVRRKSVRTPRVADDPADAAAFRGFTL